MEAQLQLPATADVVIVGAGPVGLTLAAALVSAGVDAVLVDKQTEGANTSRAAVMHARTLEVLQGLGVSEQLVRRGVIVPRFTVRDRDRVLMSVGFGQLPTAYPYTLMIPQDVTEQVLLGRLTALGGRVHRPCEVTSVTQDADGAAVVMATGETLRAPYVVGADGMHSVVRREAGITFTGSTYPQSFLLADVQLDWRLPSDEVVLYFAPEGLVVVAPLPGGRRRIVATADEAPERPTLDDVQRLLDIRGPRGALVRDVAWSSRFVVHHRLADRFRAGRLLLAGDAAHVHSPAGGQGMNTGIQDAIVLAALLADVIQGRAAEAGLDAYEAARRPVAARVVAFTDRMTRAATTRSRPLRAARNAALRTIGRAPFAQRALAMNLSELTAGSDRRATR